jgi:hypothetical protein
VESDLSKDFLGGFFVQRRSCHCCESEGREKKSEFLLLGFW